jgi:hypothetical protein
MPFAPSSSDIASIQPEPPRTSRRGKNLQQKWLTVALPLEFDTISTFLLLVNVALLWTQCEQALL